MTGAFAGRHAIVTGAGSGIGRETALLFAQEGATVLAIDPGEGASALEREAPGVVATQVDAAVESNVEAIIAAVTRDRGAPDIVVANAGISGGTAGLFDQTAADWTEILRVNLLGPFLAIKYASKAMIAADRPGVIVCTASVAGLRAGAGGAAYSASKAGVINLVQTAAQQLSGTGVRVNAVCPGLVETGMTRPLYAAARAKGREDAIGALNPLRRGAQAVEIARAIAFLASNQASYVNGHALTVDGGLSTSLPFTRPPRMGEASF